MATQKKSSKTKSFRKGPVFKFGVSADKKVYKIMREIIKADTNFEKIIKSCNSVTQDLRKENQIAV